MLSPRQRTEKTNGDIQGEIYLCVKQVLGGNQTKIGSPKSTDRDYNTVLPFQYLVPEFLTTSEVLGQPLHAYNYLYFSPCLFLYHIVTTFYLLWWITVHYV